MAAHQAVAMVALLPMGVLMCPAFSGQLFDG
jgi:hypothetical protein